MPSTIKRYLSQRVIEHLKKSGLNYPDNILLKNIQIGSYKNNTVELQISLQALKEKFPYIPNLEDFPKDETFYDVNVYKEAKLPYIGFKTKINDLVTNIINLESNIYKPKPKINKKTIVEFSSPNIAKPFHVGHLRSTIIGSFISNLKEYLGHDVVRLNYLGDWGTQFGYLKLGMDLSKVSDDEMKKNPLKYLYEAYVNANKLSITDPSIHEKAKSIFSQLEQGHLEDYDKWKTYREYTVRELINVYDRLNVKFTKYDWESMYDASSITNIIETLKNKNILKTIEDGQQIVEVNNRTVTVVKSDGSSLYLARDIAAALDRQKTYGFDEMYYVVDNSQTDHFNALFGVLDKLDSSLSDKCKHIKFGRIRGMSTRKGEAVFLKDILDEAKDVMYNRQLTTSTTKIDVKNQTTADILGTTAVIINDLKQRRTRDYKFDWTNALQMQGDSGVKLQHTHCRLHNLELNSGARHPDQCIVELLNEPEALHLIIEIARFEDALSRADNELEACVVVNYLFGLCNSINRALKALKVKNQGELGDQRLLMFHCAKRVLNRGMTILGLRPLEQM